MGAAAKQEVELFFGELKQGALLERCRTDTHKIVLTLIDGRPRSVRLEPITRPKEFPKPQTLKSGNSEMEAVAMSDEQLAVVARGCLEEADPYLAELNRRGYNISVEVETHEVQTVSGKLSTALGAVQLRITRETII